MPSPNREIFPRSNAAESSEKRFRSLEDNPFIKLGHLDSRARLSAGTTFQSTAFNPVELSELALVPVSDQFIS